MSAGRRFEVEVFGVCLVALGLHAVALALANRTAVGGALLVATAMVLAGAWIVFGRAGRGVRALVAGALGLVAIVSALAVAIPHAALAGVSVTDCTGMVSALAGLALVIVAFVVGMRGRSFVLKLVVGVGSVVVVAQFLIVPVIGGGLATHTRRTAVASAATLGLPGARDVSFSARDGVRLYGWYVPGGSGAAVVLLHGSHNTRMDTLAHLRLLSAAGYSVLAYDARGHGESAGQTNALGWRGADDLAGAVAFLRRQPGVDPRRIAALGLSMGAEEALRAAGSGVPLAAVVADGAGASTLGDSELAAEGLRPVFVSESWLTMRATELLSGEREPAPLESVVGRIRVPVLLIASGRAGERRIDEVYRGRIGARAMLWSVPDAAHTQALRRHPYVYAERVRTFLSAALGRL